MGYRFQRGGRAVNTPRRLRPQCGPISHPQQMTLGDVPNADFPVCYYCYISAKDRQKSRSLSSIRDAENLATPSDNSGEMMLQVWRLGRIAPASQLLNVPSEEVLPRFCAFCGRLLPHEDASKIGYLPLIPASPTDPRVLKEEMKRIVNTAHVHPEVVAEGLRNPTIYNNLLQQTMSV